MKGPVIDLSSQIVKARNTDFDKLLSCCPPKKCERIVAFVLPSSHEARCATKCLMA